MLFKLRKAKSKDTFMAIKSDLHKVYDSINIECIIETMRRMSFSNKWFSLIHECISSPLCSIIFNGKASPWFSTSCGIRQGDPLSLFLFLFGMTLLDFGIKEKIAQGSFAPINNILDNDNSLISYVDDVMIMT